MGRKVHPTGFRLGLVKEHSSHWFAQGREYVALLNEDRAIREAIMKRLPDANISHIGIERQSNQLDVAIKTARPGVIIGRKGATVNELREQLLKLTNRSPSDRTLRIDVQEIKSPDLHAQLVARNVSEQLTRRVSWRRAMRSAGQRTMRQGALGFMITVSGRLGGSDMGRVDTFREGQVPRHTLRANIDYGTDESKTTYGMIGVKVWIYQGEILPGDEYHAHYGEQT